MDLLMLLLRLLHIVSGVFWVGAAVSMAFFIFPAIRAAGPAGGPVMGQLMGVRKFPVYMTMAGVVTLLAGILMMWHLGSITGGAWFKASSSRTFSLGALFAIAGGVVGGTLARKTAERMGALAGEIQKAGGPPSAAQQVEMAALQNRMSKALHSVAGLLLLAAALMAVARYT